MANRPGGWSETVDATQETQKICDEVKGKVEEKTKKIYVEFQAVKYKKQIVAGANYRIKVDVGGENFIHLLVFQSLSGGIDLRDVQLPKTKHDPLE